MMKSSRKTTIGMALFFGALLSLWGLERAGVRTSWDRERRSDRVLPDLIDTPADEIRRVVIERKGEHLIFERRAGASRKWQMVEPLGVAAEPTRLETLVRNLKELRKSPDAGTITGPAATYGLDPPAATVRLFGGEASSADHPMASMEVGNVVRGNRYVRPSGAEGIEVAEARLLTPLDLPAAEWRQAVVMAVPTFQVESLSITRRAPPGGAGGNRAGVSPASSPGPRVIRAQRNRANRWKLTEPFPAPADGAKIESLLAALGSLRVVDGAKGFVADNVTNFAPFGLAEPEITIELRTTGKEDEPFVLEVGRPVPERPDRVYVRQGGQDDVVVVGAKALGEIPDQEIALRSQQVADIVPGAVSEIVIHAGSDTFSLSKEPAGWELLTPQREKADGPEVQTLLNRLSTVQTSEFLQPGTIADPRLDPPVMAIQIRQVMQDPSQRGPANQSVSVLDLKLGRHDVAKRTVYARLEGDRVILAIPETLLEVLPKNRYSFRDRTIAAESPERIRKLTIRRGARTDELEPATSGEPNSWRMRSPVDARADTATVTQALTALRILRAEEFVAGSAGDGKAFGLDHPIMTIEWLSDREHRLKIGAAVPRAPTFYATLEEQPFVFTLNAATLRPFDAEFHDRRIWSFEAARAARLVLRWPHQSITLHRRAPVSKGQLEWVPDAGASAPTIDLSRIGALVATMSGLQATRYFQYDGPLPAASGLPWPRLQVELTLAPAGPDPSYVLRVGSTTSDGQVCAAVGTADSGPGFLLPAPPWNDLIRSGEAFPPIPDIPFGPAP
jgi:hypothetical protein